MEKIVTIIGARPQFVKAAMVSKELRKKYKEILVHTGQHYDKNMSDIFFEQMNIPKPNYNLNIGSGSHGEQTGKMLIEIEKVLINEKPDFVLVYGDTNSTLAGALAASKLLIPVIHVEAGLRSYNREMPEEQNRVLTDHISDILICPTDEAVNNLKKEGITKNVYHVGDVMCDSTLHYSKLAEKQIKKEQLDYLKNLDSWYLLTIHRAENTKNSDTLKTVLDVMETLDSKVIYPVHPRVKNILKSINKKYNNVVFIDPVDYITMLYLTKNAKKVITDSGGLQKECFILDTPCITVRDQTEWIETLNDGYNRLSKPEFSELKKKIESAKINESKKKINYYGTGNAGKEILEILKKY